MRKTLPIVALERVSLRHAARMLRWFRDPYVRENVGLRASPTAQRTRAWIRRASRDPATLALAVVVEGRHVGNVVLDRIDPKLGMARLSIYIGEADARGSGIGRAAVRAALRVAFDELRLNKVWLIVHADNDKAVRTYRASGFISEGRLREEFLVRGRRVDVLYMGILREDFARRRTA